MKMAKEMNAKLGIDVEDYHPGELIYPSFLMRKEIAHRLAIMKSVLPKASYISTASNLITQEIKTRFDLEKKHNVITVENSFWNREFENKLKLVTGPIRLVWFSQNIAFGRGLEQLFGALDQFEIGSISLTLIGSLNPQFSEEYLVNRPHVTTIEPLTQVNLHAQLGDYDIGLALEDGSIDLNKDICLSNKIWAYSQAGLYVLTSKTQGQEDHLQRHPKTGLSSELSPSSLYETLIALIENKEEIRKNREQRILYFKQHSYDTETTKLKQLWNQEN
jgi:hypothetical protein